jgi:Fur family ferric uptake transcriptional regulator
LPSSLSANSVLHEAEERFSRYLAGQGLRLTAERRRLLKLLLDGERLIDADTLVRKTRRGGTPVSRATVYRTLELMVKSGLVRHAGPGEKSGRYERVVGSIPSVRLVCLGCGNLLEVYSEDIRHERDRVSRRHGFLPQHHHLEVFGRCRSCRELSGDGSRRRRRSR